MIAKKKKDLPRHLSQTEPRKVRCRECSKAITIYGTRTLPLCKPHRTEHLEKLKTDRKNRSAGKSRNATNADTMQGLPNADHGRSTVVVAPVSASPPKARSHDVRATQSPLSRPQSGGRGSFGDAVALIAASESRREGFRHGWIGNTGSGKTTAVASFLDASDRLTLIHDDTKLDAQYPGPVVSDFADCPDDANRCVFRGDVFAGTTVQVEYVADLAIQIARHTRRPLRVVVDELDRACTSGGKELNTPALRTILTQGRALGVSLLWSTQTPQRAPREVIDQSSTIALCQLGPRALSYLDERLCFDRELLDVVPTLTIGQFVIYEQGRPWNGLIYQTPAPIQKPRDIGRDDVRDNPDIGSAGPEMISKGPGHDVE